jgi:hypothetical protein
MKRQNLKSILIFRSHKGSILLAVLILYTFFALALFLTTNVILLDQMGAEYAVRSMMAFYIAEAGLVFGTAYIQDTLAEPGPLLPGPDGIGGAPHQEDDGLLPFGANVPYDRGRFTVRIRDNEEADGDPYTDSDTVFILSSTAFLDPHIQKTLWVVLQCPHLCSSSAWLEPE